MVKKVELPEPLLLQALPDGEKNHAANKGGTRHLPQEGPDYSHAAVLEDQPSGRDAKKRMSVQSVDPCDTGNLLYRCERELLVHPFVKVGYINLSELKDKLMLADSVMGNDLPAERAP